MPDYSDGPFTPVFFFHTCDGFRTFTYRTRSIMPSRSLINRISSGFADGPRFADVFVDTSLLRS